MRVVSFVSLLVTAVTAKDPSGIENVRTLLNDFQKDLTDAGKKEAKLYEEQSCTFKTAFEQLKSSITDNQGKYEEKEGKQQEHKANWEFLSGDKDLVGSVKHSKAELAAEEHTHSELKKEHQADEKLAVTTMDEAGVAINLIGKAKDALQATTEKVNSLAALVQIQQQLRKQSVSARALITTAIAKAVDGQEQPVAHNTDHSDILDMLTKLENDLGDHLDTTRSEWEVEKQRLQNLMNESDVKIKNWNTKIAEDTKIMENDHQTVLKLDQELNGLNIAIESDTKVLKETSERAAEIKSEYDADTKTRVQELQVISKALNLFEQKFGEGAVPEPKSPGVDGEPVMNACPLTDGPPVNIPKVAASFLQTASTSRKAVSFLEKKSDISPMDMTKQELLSLISSRNHRLGSAVLTSVMTSLKKNDPLKKVRVMIKNLIQRLKDEGLNEQKRANYCTEKETEFQDQRTKNKKDIVTYETGTEKAQGEIAEYNETLAKLNKLIKEQKENCAEESSQMAFDVSLRQNDFTIATHGKEGLKSVIDLLRNEFYSDAEQTQKESDYTGDTGAAQGIMSMMEGLQNNFQKTIDISTEEIAKLQAAQDALHKETDDDVKAKKAEQSGVVLNQLTPAISSYKQNGASLFQTIQEYSLTTQELIQLKFESECKQAQLSKEEEAVNKESEIQALKDALEILAQHEGTF